MRRNRMPEHVADLLDNMTDCMRLTGIAPSSLGRAIARDPCLYRDIVAYRNPNPENCARWVRSCRDLTASYLALPRRAQEYPAQPGT